MTFPAIDSLDTYGGELTTYGGPITDPTTDRSAEAANQAYASVAMMTHTAMRCWARITTAATTGAMVLVAHDAGWGNDFAERPTPSRVSSGVFKATWPATVTDELGDTQTLNLRAALPPVAEGSTAYHVQATRTAANEITFYVFDMAGVATDAVGVTVFVGAV